MTDPVIGAAALVVTVAGVELELVVDPELVVVAAAPVETDELLPDCEEAEPDGLEEDPMPFPAPWAGVRPTPEEAGAVTVDIVEAELKAEVPLLAVVPEPVADELGVVKPELVEPELVEPELLELLELDDAAEQERS